MSVPLPASSPAGSAADRLLAETWAAAQGSALTRKSYRHQGGRLLDRIAMSLAAVTVAHLQGYIASLGDMAPATIGLAVAAVKSLYAFGVETGMLATNPTGPLQAPSVGQERPGRTHP